MDEYHKSLEFNSDPESQLKILEEVTRISDRVPFFKEKLTASGLTEFKPAGIQVLQINLGNLCNQACKHCHVNAGPAKTEIMDLKTLKQCLEAIRNHRIPLVDITGGAPEMNPDFRWFVGQLRKLDKKVIVRCNLTIFFEDAKYNDLPAFYADNGLEVVASLPFYSADRTDNMRGKGVFEKSVQGLRLLNENGYGQKDSGLMLNLVYNPSGAFLAASQKLLEDEFRHNLFDRYGIEFTNLYTINNMPVSRFLDYLLRSGNYIAYIEHLVNAFNPVAAAGVMCLNMISVSWNGFLYDCDFNQMLDLKILGNGNNHISAFDPVFLLNRDIRVSQHCYGCTAGSGSSCGGSIV